MKLNSVQPKVTCVIPSYKRCDTVIRAIDSALSQTYKNIEVCLVDDNDPDDEYSLKLQNMLKKYDGDKRVKYVSQIKHINGAVARNLGIKAAKGEYIAFLDDDDEWLNEKIERQLAVLKQNPDADGVTTLWTLYKNGKELRRCPSYTSDNLQFKIFSRQIAVYTSTVLIKKEAIERFSGFNENLLRHQDLQFLIDALNHSRFLVLQEYLVKLHADSEINRPNVQNLIIHKHKFLEAEKLSYLKYDLLQQRRILDAHNYEIAFCALKCKEYKIAIKYIVKAGFNIYSIIDLLKRLLNR